MAVEIKIPESGESITQIEIGQWYKAEGQRVERDEPVVQLETDKASLDLPAPVAGLLTEILKREGEVVSVGAVIGHIDETAEPSADREDGGKRETAGDEKADEEEASEQEAKGDPEARDSVEAETDSHGDKKPPSRTSEPPDHADESDRPVSEAGRERTEPTPSVDKASARKRGEEDPKASTSGATGSRPGEEAVRMTLIRRRIAKRLVEAQQTAALLTSFNEIDLSAVIAMRKDRQAEFQEAYGCKLGFMSFFVKAAVDALKRFPAINAEVRGEHIVYRNRYDIGIAVATDMGLVVPVLRGADKMRFSDIEKAIAELASRAKKKTIQVEDLQGGTFTITNGGVYGSLLSTPIVNPPQSGILGLHAIQERPVAHEGQVVIRPMMYVALTYDHRIVDGRDAVLFLQRIKACIEAPARMLVEV